jgi:hypothetical protein
MKKKFDLTGEVFYRLTVLAEAPRKAQCHSTRWLCRCECGTVKTYTSDQLRKGRVKSCGCLRSENLSMARRKHDESKTRLYKKWTGIITRCYNPKCKSYKNYGGRGITMCEEWRNSYEAFRDWALAHGFREGLQIDRIDTNGNYCPSNCRWITSKQNQRNRTNNRLLTAFGVTQPMSVWCEEFDINEGTLRKRMKLKWTMEDALTVPVRCKKQEE